MLNSGPDCIPPLCVEDLTYLDYFINEEDVEFFS